MKLFFSLMLIILTMDRLYAQDLKVGASGTEKGSNTSLLNDISYNNFGQTTLIKSNLFVGAIPLSSAIAPSLTPPKAGIPATKLWITIKAASPTKVESLSEYGNVQFVGNDTAQFTICIDPDYELFSQLFNPSERPQRKESFKDFGARRYEKDRLYFTDLDAAWSTLYLKNTYHLKFLRTSNLAEDPSYGLAGDFQYGLGIDGPIDGTENDHKGWYDLSAFFNFGYTKKETVEKLFGVQKESFRPYYSVFGFIGSVYIVDILSVSFEYGRPIHLRGENISTITKEVTTVAIKLQKSL